MDDELKDLRSLNKSKGFKVLHLNIRSLHKKIDQLQLLLQGSNIDVFTISETWLKEHLSSQLYSLQNYTLFRQDRSSGLKVKKRGGGLVTYIHKSHASNSEPLPHLSACYNYVEAQWLKIHRPNCKSVIICNIYRPPGGDLGKLIEYLDNCLASLNMAKSELFILGDFNVNYKNKSSPDFKKLSFFAKSSGLSQLINNTTRNTDKSRTLIDLILTNSKYVKAKWSLRDAHIGILIEQLLLKSLHKKIGKFSIKLGILMLHGIIF